MANHDEYQHIEFTRTLGERHEGVIALAAFATSQGGEVRFGIDPDGHRSGVQLGRNTLEELANYIKTNTDPPIFPSITVEGDPGDAVVVVRTEESPIKPVWAFSTPYKRVGRTNQKISREETERLFDLTRGMTWDALPCSGLKIEHLDRALVESYLRRARQDETEATEVLLDNLSLRAGNQLLNGAALLFASNPQRWIPGSYVKCARFRGTNSVDFIDEQSFSGDVVSQIEKALAFVDRILAIRFASPANRNATSCPNILR
jgi:ATP-dependent DNA helicase RecG